MDMLRLLLVLMLALPGAGAIAVALCGAGRAPLVRQISLAVTVVDLLLAMIVTVGFLSTRADPPAQAADTFHPAIVPGDPRARPRVPRLAADARLRHARRLSGLRHHPLLCLLRADAGSSLLPHRHLGRPGTPLCCPQVLHLHARRQPDHAPGHPGG